MRPERMIQLKHLSSRKRQVLFQPHTKRCGRYCLGNVWCKFEVFRHVIIKNCQNFDEILPVVMDATMII